VGLTGVLGVEQFAAEAEWDGVVEAWCAAVSGVDGEVDVFAADPADVSGGVEPGFERAVSSTLA